MYVYGKSATMMCSWELMPFISSVVICGGEERKANICDDRNMHSFAFMLTKFQYAFKKRFII